jgi:two-component system CheB/CheR fusion protein
MNPKKSKPLKSSKAVSGAKTFRRIVPSDKSEFPVVGIGASAGGLEALELFFLHVPAGCDIAFVVIQHLDPTHKSIMSSLLKKYTAMEITEIADGMKVEKNRVYLAPPNFNVAIIGNTLHHVTPEKSHGVNLPIDYFFRSLAEDQAERSIGIILSGTGSDGTLGMREIKGAGGMAMAQAEEQAKFSGMPKSAIDTGIVDFVLPAESMPGQLIRYAKHPYLERAKATTTKPPDFQIAIQKILLLIRKKTGHDFSLYKHNTIRRGIERRMALHQMERIAEFLRYLEQNDKEIEALFKELLINVTRFFRDPEAFEELAAKAIPGLFEHKDRAAPFRIWVPGCSTGEEAYSLAILLIEAMEMQKKNFTLQIFASDIDMEAIEAGRSAIYPESISADVSENRLNRFFTKEGASYRVKKQIRECVIFALHDIVKDPPFSRLDLISCRNVLIYMDQALQKKILPVFHYSLADNGILFLGTSESIGDLVTSFATVDTKWKIYRKKSITSGRSDYRGFSDRPLTVPQSRTLPAAAGGFRPLGEKVLLENFVPPSVLVNEKFEILYCYGPIDRYLAIPPGEPSLNILRIAREGLRYKLGPALLQARKGTEPVLCNNVCFDDDGSGRSMDITIHPIIEPGDMQRLFLIVFREGPAIKASGLKAGKVSGTALRDDAVALLEQELKVTRDTLQNTIEALQTANEEFQSTNEELQSTNEELETSKEELQSTNEELGTVNSELQHKVDQLMDTGNDVNNLLASTEIASLFLDMGLCIKRFTPAMVKIFRLLGTDIGRSIRDITSTIKSFDICAAAQGVLDTLERREAEVRNEDGRWYTLRIIPYRTMENIIEGVVMTFIDITDLRHASREQEEARLLADGIVDTIHDPFVILDAGLNVRSINEPFCAFFKVKSEGTVNRRIYELGNGQWNIPQLRELLSSIVPGNTKVTNYVVTHEFPGIGRKTMSLNARRIAKNKFILLSMVERPNPRGTLSHELRLRRIK